VRKTLTIRLPDDLADWLAKTAKKTGIPQRRIVREQLEKAQNIEKQGFLRLAGKVSGPRDLSQRKGFSQT
jgi:predicted DNA-binding protein